MSMDKSLKIRGKLVRSRNVLNRAERLALMERRRTWVEGDPIFGLPKTKVDQVKQGGQKKKKKVEEGGEEE